MKKILSQDTADLLTNLTAKLLQLGYEVEGWELGDIDDPPVAGKNLVIHLGAISDTTFSALDEIMTNNLDLKRKTAPYVRHAQGQFALCFKCKRLRIL